MQATTERPIPHTSRLPRRVQKIPQRSKAPRNRENTETRRSNLQSNNLATRHRLIARQCRHLQIQRVTARISPAFDLLPAELRVRHAGHTTRPTHHARNSHNQPQGMCLTAKPTTAVVIVKPAIIPNKKQKDINSTYDKFNLGSARSTLRINTTRRAIPSLDLAPTTHLLLSKKKALSRPNARPPRSNPDQRPRKPFTVL